jgi:hypothetical protein
MPAADALRRIHGGACRIARGVMMRASRTAHARATAARLKRLRHPTDAAMRRIAALLGILLPTACATTAPIDATAVAGRWRCGPTVLHGAGFDVTVSTDTTYGRDARFDTLTRSVITRAGHPAVTTQDRAQGTWALSGDVLRTTVQRVQFLSSSDPKVSVREGQRLQDAQLKRRAVFESRLRRIDATHWTTSPVDGSGAGTNCTRE